MRRHLAWLLLLACPAAGSQPADVVLQTVHVATDGNDAWTGRQARPGVGGEGPLRTLAAAQRAARSALAKQRGGVQVLVQPGTYTLAEPLRFGPADSGRPGQPMVWRASAPGAVTLSGAVALTLRPDAGSRNEAVFDPPKALPPGFWSGGPQLYLNGERAVLARQPNDGSAWFVGTPLPVPGESANALGHEAFHATKPALDFVRRLSADDRARAVVHVMQSWSSGLHRLASGAPDDALRVSPRSPWPFLFFGTNQRYWVQNVVAAYDAPSEWIGSTAGVRYRLAPGDASPPTALLPVLQQLVVVAGDGPGGTPVQYLELVDLGFAHSLAATPPGGWVDNQAAVDIGAAIEVDNARHVRITGCRITATGGHAIWLRQNVRDSEVSGCTMTDLGGGAVKVGEAAAPGTKAAATAGGTGAITISNNRISQTGRQYPGAVAVWVGRSFDNLISHNSIEDTTYTGISVGWQWGYGGPSAGRNRIVGNSLNNIGGRALSDVGGIYTLGEQPGTVIADNLIREVRGYSGQGAGAWGIYNDEGSSDMRVEGNVVVGTDSGGYHLHFGRNLLVQDNLFALGDAAEVSVTRSEPGRRGLTLRNNLLVTGSVNPLGVQERSLDTDFSGNLVAPVPPGRPLSLQACGNGCSLSAATLTMGVAADSLRLQGLEPERARRWQAAAAAAGAQEPAPPTGTLRPAGASAKARQAAVQPAERAPALQLTMNLSGTPDGQRPPGWRYLPVAPAESMGVVADPSAPGGRCLQLVDAPTFAQRYEPYFFTALNHDGGSSTVSFAVKVDDTTDLVHEWRDDSKPFRTGPSVRINRAGVQVAGRVLAPVQPGIWMRLQVRASLKVGATWDLVVTDASGRTYTATGMPTKTPGWQNLRWLGFIADAAVTARACLADIRVSNLPEGQPPPPPAASAAPRSGS